MISLYQKYGFYREGLESITLKGIDGVERINSMMDSLRKNPPETFADFKVLAIRDYYSGKVVDLDSGSQTDTGLPKSNVLYYELDNDAWCCVRPSGTEPKIKFYMGVKGKNLDDADEKLKDLTNAILEITH